MKKKLGLLLTSVVMAGSLAACGNSGEKEGSGSSADKKVLTVGTSADYKPFEYVETASSEEIIGFDIDIIKKIGKDLGYQVQVKDIDFNSLIPALENGTVDVVISSMTPTPEREKTVDFSDIYYEAENMIVAKKDSNIKTIEDLEGKNVGVQLASIQEELANDIAKKEKIDFEAKKLNRIPEIFQEIAAGRFDAAIIEDTVAKGYLEDNKDLAGFEIDNGDEKTGTAIAFEKGSSLTDDFNKELKKMKDSGELDKLIVKWFDGETK
ncbi:transporter substrate-binding domain-containing protein [Bacillus massiliglaciei]|uniref:transporter substrate-binding domain-containing protein n=1 Tax=Bacillus massiliglaciei TaxID=1816693 RepID=UPI000DA5F13C|nr:transporter substrate-binding domain-containing protein [Bacillus massiliglaciei]